jgi:hypothetical protein
MPFRLKPTPAGASSVGYQRTSPSKAEVFEHVHRTDDTDYLQEVARELGAPDHTIGKGVPKEGNESREKHADHKESPLYPEETPWPKITTKAPFRLRENKS